MDSQWFHGAGDRSNGIYNRNDEGNAVDLTLKLGLPNEDKDQSHLSQHVNHVPTIPNLANFNFNGHYTHQGASNSYGMVREGGQGAINHYGIVNRQVATGLINYRMVNHGGNAGISNPIGGQNYNSWTPVMGNSSSGINLSHQYSTGEMMGVPAAYPNFNGGLPASALTPFPTPSLNSYTLIDSSPIKVATDDRSGSSSGISGWNKDSRRQRYGTSNDPNKRCTNYNCNTNDTPMWRKGPLGPKTLCNACGIKYRKEGEKRRAKEAAKNSNSNP